MIRKDCVCAVFVDQDLPVLGCFEDESDGNIQGCAGHTKKSVHSLSKFPLYCTAWLASRCEDLFICLLDAIVGISTSL